MIEKIKLSDSTEMQIYIARGTSDQKLPGIILFQEAFGVNQHIKDVAERIAALGYVVYAPELFHHTAGDNFVAGYGEFQTKVMPHYQGVIPQTLEIDIKGTYEALKNDPAVDPEKIGSIGFCMGGKASFFANSILPLKAAISLYGGGISEMLERVPQMSAPLFLIWGGKDGHIKEHDRKSIADALTAQKKPYLNTVLSEADHGFFCNERPSYHEASATLAWSMIQSFFKEYLV